MRSNTARLHLQTECISPLGFATDPVGDTRPIYPNIDRPALPELWRENLRKRERKPQKKNPKDKHLPPERRIDDFA